MVAAAGDRYMLGRVERAVEKELHTGLTRQCAEERQRRKDVQAKAAGATGDRKAKLQKSLEKMGTPSCDAYSRYFEHNAHHQQGGGGGGGGGGGL